MTDIRIFKPTLIEERPLSLGSEELSYAPKLQQASSGGMIARARATNVQRLKDKLRSMTAGNTQLDSNYTKLTAVNAVLRGWSEYFKHVSSSRTFSKLDFWVEGRLFHWLSEKHRLGIRVTLIQFVKLQTPTRRNIGIQYEQDKILWLYIMAKEQHITPYKSQKVGNPFMASAVPPVRRDDIPDIEQAWKGGAPNSDWRDIRLTILQRDNFRCTNPNCGSTQNLDVHHIIPRAQRPDLALNLDNLTTLCEKCHIAEHRTGVLGNRTIHPQPLQGTDTP